MPSSTARDRDGHFGLLLFAKDTFPRHRHELFLSQMVAALEDALVARPEDDCSGPVPLALTSARLKLTSR